MLWLAAKDTHGNINATVLQLPFVAPDVTPPVFLGMLQSLQMCLKMPRCAGVCLFCAPLSHPLTLPPPVAATSAISFDDSSMTVSATLNKPRCAVYCVIMPSPSKLPTPVNVFNGSGAQVEEGEGWGREGEQPEGMCWRSGRGTPSGGGIWVAEYDYRRGERGPALALAPPQQGGRGPALALAPPTTGADVRLCAPLISPWPPPPPAGSIWFISLPVTIAGRVSAPPGAPPPSLPITIAGGSARSQWPLPRRLPQRQRLGQRHRLDPRYAVRRVPRGQGRPWQPPGRRHVHTVSVDPSQVRLSPSTPGGGGLSIHTKGLDPLLGWHQQAVWASTLCTHEMPGPAYSPSLNTRLGGAPSWGRLYAPCVERKWPKCPEGSKCSCSCLQSGFLSCPRGCTPT